MRLDLKRIGLVLCTALVAACSLMPHIARPTVATAPQSQQARYSPPEATDAVGTASAASGAVNQSLVRAGYSVQRRHDRVFYCRNEVITGNRIGTWVCLTAAQIQYEQQDGLKVKDRLNQPSTRCLGASCNN